MQLIIFSNIARIQPFRNCLMLVSYKTIRVSKLRLNVTILSYPLADTISITRIPNHHRITHLLVGLHLIIATGFLV
jgi:hypothetical protein